MTSSLTINGATVEVESLTFGPGRYNIDAVVRVSAPQAGAFQEAVTADFAYEDSRKINEVTSFRGCISSVRSEFSTGTNAVATPAQSPNVSGESATVIVRITGICITVTRSFAVESCDSGDIPDGGYIKLLLDNLRQVTLENSGGLYSCTCSAWRTSKLLHVHRTCSHLCEYRGYKKELLRLRQVESVAPFNANVFLGKARLWLEAVSTAPSPRKKEELLRAVIGIYEGCESEPAVLAACWRQFADVLLLQGPERHKEAHEAITRLKNLETQT